jgi:hypothetical protein
VSGRGAEGPVWLADASVRPLRPAALVQQGFLEVPAVMKEMERHVGELARCYEARRVFHPDLAGMVIMRWTITTKGTVPEHSVKPDYVRDEGVLSCLEQIIHKARFPESSGGTVEVSLPFFLGTPPPPGFIADGC